MKQHAHLNETIGAVVIEHLTVRDKDVAREAQRWTTGERGPVVDDPEALADADLSEFVSEAVKIGSHALSATGQSQDARALEQMVKDVGVKASESSTKASEATERAVKSASDTMTKAANDAQKAITEAEATASKRVNESVSTATSTLQAEVQRLFSGENPELVGRLQPLLAKFGTDLGVMTKENFTQVLEKAAKQFDPSDPTSPMAKHTTELTARQQELTDLIGKNHAELGKRVDELAAAVTLERARATLSKVTPIKGGTFENQVNVVLAQIAAGLGDEYVDTGGTVGSVSRSKKGDGVLTVDGGATRVVLEMTDSARAGWAEYLDEAERNRQAAAALGLVRTAEQNGGQSIRVLGTRRIVMAFDPTSDDPDLVRTVVMLLRTAALAATTRRGADQLDTAEEKVNEALAQLEKLDDVKKTAGSIHKNAVKIETSCTAITSGIQRLLSDALSALGDAQAGPSGNTSAGAVA
ncbi:MAG: Fis family transcriptional regulator [Actinomycetia bacterium]|nr:Fis family transcriptional regulator [Actinomycetes bacterium]